MINIDVHVYIVIQKRWWTEITYTYIEGELIYH